jgi:hypothetical protein
MIIFKFIREEYILFKKILLFGIVFLLIAPMTFVTGINISHKNEDILNITETKNEITDILSQVDEEILSYYLEKFVSFGFKKTGSENASRAASWIKSEFESLGLETYYDEWSFPKYKDKNVIALHPGKDKKSDAVLLVSAHYDTIGGSPGANDDGSGIAAMLTIANLTSNMEFNHTIRFIAVSGEEVGVYGSFHDAKKAYCKKENIIAMLNIDMIGYANSFNENLMQIFCPQRAQWIVDLTKENAEKYNSNLNLIIQHTLHYPADHENYNDLGYDAVQYIQAKPEDATWFHTPDDNLDRITYNYLVNVTKLILTVACDIADRAIPIQVQITRPKEAYIYVFDRPLIKLPCYNLYTTRIRAITYLLGKTTVELNITTDEEINSVYFGIDGYMRHIVSEPPYEWKIGTEIYKFFSLKGFHRITVCVTTNTGHTAYDEMDIFITRII